VVPMLMLMLVLVLLEMLEPKVHGGVERRAT
jgi:hypothetical protein